MENNEILWSDRKRWILFGLPWSFTKYSLTDNRLLIDTGFFTTNTDEVRLYRINDLSLTRNLLQKMGNMGTIKVNSYDKTMGNFEIKNIKNPQEVKEKLSRLVEEERDKKRVYAREVMGDDCDCDHDGV
ncbi:MAG: PH domain-containing protein [Lachnospiraceae bacterium]|nr:PH domain-containing protein [Lachnospiraceae bacterium]